MKKERVKGGQPGSYYAALGGVSKAREKEMDSSDYWSLRVKEAERHTGATPYRAGFRREKFVPPTAEEIRKKKRLALIAKVVKQTGECE